MNAKWLLLLPVLLLPGCMGGSRWQGAVVPPAGALITIYKAPITTDFSNTPVAKRKGTASTQYFFDFLFTGSSYAWDDAAIQKAAEDGELTKVYYADYEALSILGIYAKFTVTAYGE
ncbi:MAG: TRL domain-containing protein [Candidatus Brocadiia bacterium]|jgi:hypothetical protein|nr:TRL domain-containing protein [Candidatus Brocadiia bacterium]